MTSSSNKTSLYGSQTDSSKTYGRDNDNYTIHPSNLVKRDSTNEKERARAGYRSKVEDKSKLIVT
jgi:hypothetical protein